MKEKMTAVIAMFLLIIVLLLSSFQLAIYGDADFSWYEKEYLKYSVTDSLSMEIDDVMTVSGYMMDYLIGKEDVLSIEANVDGEEQDFFNEQDRLHMADVRNLFIGGLYLRDVLLILCILMVVFMIFKKWEVKKLLAHAYNVALAVFLSLLVFLGVACAIDFTKVFTIFHHIFFTNDLWLFDPRTDYMIRMLPEGFFFDMVVRIGGVFVASLLVVKVCFLILNRKGKSIRK